MAIPLTLVTGFLGSGKTTFLAEAVRRYPTARIVYLVNEFSPTDVDGLEVRAHTDRVMSIAGGSIFCRCLVGEFIHHLTRIPSEYAVPSAPVDGVVVEASGVADPRVILKMLAETRLDRVYRMARVFSVVDPASLHKLLCTLPNIRGQIEAADTVVVNKIDLHDEATLQRTETAVREIHPDARIVRAERCRFDMDLLGEGVRSSAEGDFAACRDPNFLQISILCPDPVDLEGLRGDLERLGADVVYRCKGTVSNADGTPVRVEYSSSGFEATPSRAGNPGRELVFIHSPDGTEPVRQMAEKLGTVRFSSPAS